MWSSAPSPSSWPGKIRLGVGGGILTYTCSLWIITPVCCPAGWWYYKQHQSSSSAPRHQHHPPPTTNQAATRTQRNLKNTSVHLNQCLLAEDLHNWLLSMQLNDLTSHFLSSQTQSESQGRRIFVKRFSVYFELFMHFSNFLQQYEKLSQI